MQRILLLVKALFFLGTLCGQDLPDKDSLLHIWENPSMADSTRMSAMYQLIDKHYKVKDPDSARQYSELLYQMALEKKSVTYQAKAQMLQGYAAMYLGNYEDAMIYTSKALALFEELEDLKGMSAAYNVLGVLNKEKGN